MTKEEKKSIVDEVLKVVHAESQEVSQLQKSDNADEFLSLPVITTNGELKTLKMGTFKDALQKTNGSDREDINKLKVDVSQLTTSVTEAKKAATENTVQKIEEHTVINTALYKWIGGGIKKPSGEEEVSNFGFAFSEKISVEGYSEIEFQYQSYTTSYCTALYDNAGRVLQVFGVDVQGQGKTFESTRVALPENASYLKMTGYTTANPKLTLIKKLSVSEKINNVESDVDKVRDSIKPLFIKDVTDDIAYSVGGINTADGTLNPNGFSVYGASDFIEIPANAVKVNIGYQGFASGFCSAIYDASKRYLKSYAVSSDGKLGDVRETGEIAVPDGAKYIRITGYLSSVKAKKIPLVFILNTVNAVSRDELVKAGIVAPTKSKKLAFCGDSITFGANPDGGEAPLYAWPQQVGRLLGCQVTNYGVNGASAGGESPRVWSKAYNVVAEDTDIIGVMIGINDWAHGYAIGSVEQKTGFCGALHTMWQGFLKRFPPSAGKRIFCMIYPRIDIKPTGDIPAWSVWVKAIREVAEYYAIPILDFSKELGIDPHLDTEFIYWRRMAGTTDGTHDAHPTQITHNMMGKVVAAYVKSHYDI